MSTLRIGELCAGYGGLGLAVQQVLGGEVAWVADNDPGAAKILAERFPWAPNHGDITSVDWSTAEPVDVLCAGFPCQPFSAAGRRLGHEDERWLWDDVARAIKELSPPLVVLENVPGLLTSPGRQPDCVCGWNYRWGGLLGAGLADRSWADEVLAASSGSDGEAARLERALGHTRWSPGGGLPEEAWHGGDADLGVGWLRSSMPPDPLASLPAGEAGAGGDNPGATEPRLADVIQGSSSRGRAAGDSVDPGGIGGVGEGGSAYPSPERARQCGPPGSGCPACGRPVDDPAERPVRGAVGDVLWDLSRLGFHAQWCRLPAAGVGCCHLRWRVFLIAWPAADAEREPVRVLTGGVGRTPGAHQGEGGQREWLRPDDRDGRSGAAAHAAGVGAGEPADEALTLTGSRDARAMPGGRGDRTPADTERDELARKPQARRGPQCGTPAARDSAGTDGGGA